METILLVDDDDYVRPMVRDILEMSGYTVLDAAGAEQAMKVEAAHAEPIHLLLTDVMMPGLTGPQLARRLRPRRPEMNVLFMSAFTLADFQSRQIEVDAGAPLLAKPFSVEGLARKVEEVLTGSASADGTVPATPTP
jgi:DNA-binding response OmpR family regulator